MPAFGKAGGFAYLRHIIAASSWSSICKERQPRIKKDRYIKIDDNT